MKKIILSTLSFCAVGVALQVNAGSFTFTSTDGSGIDATGWVNTDDGTATAGTMVVTGGQDAGVWSLVDLGDIPANDGATVPSGQYFSPSGYDIDNWFYVNPGPQVDYYGLLWQNTAGEELNLASQYEPGAGNVPVSTEYGLFDNIIVGGNMTCSVPDGGFTASMLGMALIGVGFVRRMVK